MIDAMSTMIYGYRWKYRPVEDELVFMSCDQVFKLMVMPNIGRQKAPAEVAEIAKQFIIDNIAELRSAEKFQKAS